MDEAFFLRARRLLGERQPARLDHRSFLAEVAARQAETPTARASARMAGQPPPGATPPIAALIRGDSEWRQAVQIQGGCFSRAAARRAVNRP